MTRPKEKCARTYRHTDKKRINTPDVGLANVARTKNLRAKPTTYSYDPHIEPRLNWAGKYDKFQVSVKSLNVHERIDPSVLVNRLLNDCGTFDPFFDDDKKITLPDACNFYQFERNWSNRLIGGDSLLVMNSLLKKEHMSEKIQMIYFDPPYGINYSSNFQPGLNNTTNYNDQSKNLSHEPETIHAFRDTWELGIHSFLTYFRDRIKLAHKLLADSGSIFIQISDKNLGWMQSILNEIFGGENYVSIISFRTTGNSQASYLPIISDYIIWYAKCKQKMKHHKLYLKRQPFVDGKREKIEINDGSSIRRFTATKDEYEQKYKNAKLITGYFGLEHSSYRPDQTFPVMFENQKYVPRISWKVTQNAMSKLIKQNRVVKLGNTLSYIRYYDDFPYTEISNMWYDTFNVTAGKKYVVQTSEKVIERCMAMTTDPGDLVFDPTSGSGTTALVAERLGRRWITCDTSRISIAITRKRLITATYKYYKLKNSIVSNGIECETTKQSTLSIIANETPTKLVELIDQLISEPRKIRVSGPFTVEALPASSALSIDELHKDNHVNKVDWVVSQQILRDELEHNGIRLPENKRLQFSSVIPHESTRWIHAEAVTDDNKRVLVSFGPETAALNRHQVERAIDEAEHFSPTPDILVFAAFHIDTIAKEIIDRMTTTLKIISVQVNPDLMTLDLRKNSDGDPFWLVGSPDIKIDSLDKDGKISVEVMGFDYFNLTNDGPSVISGGKNKIAMWSIDPDYDGRSFVPNQIFFPASPKDSERQLKNIQKTLKANIPYDKLISINTTKSPRFKPGAGQKIAVKIMDDRGIETIKIMAVDEFK